MVDCHLEVAPADTLQGEVRVPGDKSISHRAVILGGIASGRTILHGFLPGADCLHTLQAMRALGVSSAQPALEQVYIDGVGLHGLQAPSHLIECGNSGTTMRLLAGLLAAQPFSSILSGDASLQQRPMERVVLPLRTMGANVSGADNGNGIVAPLQFHGTEHLSAIHYDLPVASAQVKSCLLLAGLYAYGQSRLIEQQPTRDHTERMLSAFGADIVVHNNKIVLTPGKPLLGREIYIPGDLSAAAFFIGGASMKPGSHVVIRDVGVNPTRMGVIKILQQMGAEIILHHWRDNGGEPIADIEVKGRKLHGITIPAEWVVSAMDEFPLLFVVAAGAHGETILRGAQELKVKESDRIAAMAVGLRALGCQLEVLSDGMIIQGGTLQGGVVDSAGDHRVAMAFTIASLLSSGPIRIQHCQNISTSFPNFCEQASQLGLSVLISKE